MPQDNHSAPSTDQDDARAVTHRGDDDRPSTQCDDDQDEREATELTEYQCSTTNTASTSRASSAIWPIATISRFWKRNISLTVAHDDCRDHLANERTFLAYLRTSLALSMIGIVTTQLFRIQAQAPINTTTIDYYDLGKPLGAAFQIAAMIFVGIACHRFLRQQLSMARGKVWASGWELYVVIIGVLLLLVGLLILVLGVDEMPKR